jgi:DNA-binding NarL/FixJ family response regulator
MRQALLMSDQPEIAESVCKCLEAGGYFSSLTSEQCWSLSVVELLKPDIILWDVTSKQNENYLFSEALRAHPVLCATPLILISQNSNYAERVSALKAGADLIIDSTFMPEELLAMTDALVNQSVRLRRHSVIAKYQPESTVARTLDGFPVVFTSCEKPILKRVARGEHNKEIAKALGVSRRTVESHITNMLNKTGLNNRTQLARWAMEHHDVQPVFSGSNPFFRS